MDCEQVKREGTIERYLTGRLAGDERTTFEQHMFECPRCLDELQALRAVQEELWDQGSAPVAGTVPERRVWMRRWALAAAALALVTIGAVVLWRLGMFSGNSRGLDPRMAALAEFEAPAYLPLALRGGTDEAEERFRTGMDHYTAGRYPEAIRDLRAAETLHPRASHVLFFLGVSYLLTGETDKGISRLEKAVSLSDPAYAAEARFYLAKAWLRKGDAAKARIELEAVVDSRNRLADEAARLLAFLSKSPSL